METDPVMVELWAAREALAESLSDDLELLCEELQARQHESGRRGVTLPPRRPEGYHAASPIPTTDPALVGEPGQSSAR